MPTQKVNQEEINQKLFGLFCEYGYDGASIDLMSKAIGLKRASLYHLFPKGKMEMAQHVLKIVEHDVETNIASVLTDKTQKPAVRLKKTIKSFDAFYNGGANNCLFRTLTVGADAAEFKTTVAHCFSLISNAFADFAIESGATEAEAAKKAKTIVMLIQGSLVLAGATGDKSYFKQCLAQIPEIIGV